MEKHGTDGGIFSRFPVEKQWQEADFNAQAVDGERGLHGSQRAVYLSRMAVKKNLEEHVPGGLAGAQASEHWEAAAGTGDALPGSPPLAAATPQPLPVTGAGGLAVAAPVASLVCAVTSTLKN